MGKKEPFLFIWTSDIFPSCPFRKKKKHSQYSPLELTSERIHNGSTSCRIRDTHLLFLPPRIHSDKRRQERIMEVRPFSGKYIEKEVLAKHHAYALYKFSASAS
jgi:hypothetical protein